MTSFYFYWTRATQMNKNPRFSRGVREIFDKGPAEVSPRIWSWDGKMWLPFGEAQLKPLRGGEQLAWRVQ